MFIVKIQNDKKSVTIHNQTEKLLSGSVVKGINTIDSFTFSILPSNIGFNLLHDMTTLVSVYNTKRARYEFHGRVLYTTAEMTDSGLISKSVVCESYFGYFCDSQQEYVAEKSWTVNGLLSHIITKHNALLEDGKKFTLRKVEVTDPNDKLFVGIQRENTWETIKKKLIEVLGGEITYEVVGDTIYLDYLNQVGAIKTTEITLSHNMKAITRERDPSEYITRLIPLGAKKGEDTEERYDITSVNGGVNYIDDEKAIKEYGIRVGYVEWDDVNTPSILLTKARAWLVENGKVPVKYSITALDLSLLGLDIDDFDVGNTHPIDNSLLGIEDTARIIKKTINISDETKSTIEVGEKFKTLTEIQQDQKREAQAAVKVIQKVSGNYVGKNDNNHVVQMVNKSTEKVQINGNRLEVNGHEFGLSDDGKLAVDDVRMTGVFSASGERYGIPVLVVIDDGEIFTFGTSTELLISGAQQIGDGTEGLYKDNGNLRYTLLPWGLSFSYLNMNDGIWYKLGGITSAATGNPEDAALNEYMEMYGDWKVTGNVVGSSSGAVVSDKNKKNTITELSEKYSVLFDKLKPCLFKYNDGTSDRLHVGFIAQEVKEAMDAAGVDTKDFAALCIKQKRDGTEDWALRYSEFIAMNTMEIQKLKARVSELEKLLKNS